MQEIKDKENLESVKKTITRLVGFDCSQYSDTFITRRVEMRLRANAMGSFAEYNIFLTKSEEERKNLNKELSIHVTNFFRDKEMWKVFKDEVIPMVVKLKKEKKLSRINIWSAGCSSGEEPLSIAICFLETLGLKSYNVSIIGTDIDAATIEKAKKGEYEEPQFREMEPSWKEKYFNLGDGLFKANDEIMSMIQYKTANIHTLRPKNLDIIFCRNTVIYFSIDAKSGLYNDFYDCLNKDGFLIIGKTEILQGTAREKFQVFDGKERIYINE